MGRTHRVEATFPRLAEPLGYVPKEDILYAIKAIVVTQRENGRRDDRRYSRMKYLVDKWGIDKFRSVVEQYYGKKLEAFRELPEWEFKSYLGWQEQVPVIFCFIFIFSCLNLCFYYQDFAKNLSGFCAKKEKRRLKEP